MAARFTQEQLDKLDKETIIRLFLGLQEQSEELTREVHDLNEKMQLMLEQLVLSKKNRLLRNRKTWNCLSGNLIKRAPERKRPLSVPLNTIG